MKDIIIYGAGKMGTKYARLLCNCGIEITGFRTYCYRTA